MPEENEQNLPGDEALALMIAGRWGNPPRSHTTRSMEDPTVAIERLYAMFQNEGDSGA